MRRVYKQLLVQVALCTVDRALQKGMPDMTDHTTAVSLEGLDQDYVSRLTLKASPDAVFDALTTLDGLAAWWTPFT